MKPRWIPALVSCLAALAGSSWAADWPQWRGPDRTDISKETGLLKSWPKDGPRLLWTYSDAGIGYSGPAVIGDTLYTLGGDGSKEFVYAFDTKNQKRLWSTEVGDFFESGNGDGPRATPTVDGDHLHVLTGPGDLTCLETGSGKKVWHCNLRKDLKGEMASGWGYSESVLVDGDKVVCTPGGKEGAAVSD